MFWFLMIVATHALRKKTVNMKLLAKLTSISKVTVEGSAIVWVGFSL